MGAIQRTAVIERIDVVQYDGPVINLQTGAEEFVAEGVVVHNCPHAYTINPDRVARDDCPLLWMGE